MLMDAKKQFPTRELPESLKWLDEEFLNLQWLQDTLRAAERLPSSKRKSDLIKHLSNAQADQMYPVTLIEQKEIADKAIHSLNEAKEQIESLRLENAKWMKILLKHNLITTPDSRTAQEAVRERRKTIFWTIVFLIGIAIFIQKFGYPNFLR